MAFDPDAFLLEEDEEETISQQPAQTLPSAGFDPDAFLAEEEEPAYQYDPSGFRRKKPVSPKAQKEIGTLEGIANAARNAFDSSRQALDIVGDVTPEEAQNIAKIEFDKQSRKVAPGYDEYQKAEGFDAVLAFAKNPIEVTSNIVAEGLAGSLPALGAGLAAGGVGAAIGAPTVIGAPIGFTAGQVAGTFAGSLATEYGSKILEEMQEGGVDLTKPESIQGFFENEEAVAAARDKAISRGIPVAAFDAISAGIGGKLGRVIGKQFLTKTGEAAAELGVQAGLGGAGAIAGPLAAGEQISGKEVFGEVIGEVGPGAAEIITGRMADRAARVKAEENAKIKAAAELSDNLEQNSAPLTAAAVKSTTATTVEQDKLAAQLEEQLDADEIASQVSGQLAVTKEPTAAAPKPMSKDEFKAIYSQVAPEELDAAEAGFTQQAATDATEESRISAQNALEAIKEVKATVIPPATPVAPTITPAVTPAVPTAQPPITDATQEIIQPEGVRQEPQDRVEGETPAETIARNRLLGAARGQEEGQVAPTPTAEEPLAAPTAPAIPEAITRAIEERKPISAPFALQYGIDLPRGWRYEDDFFVPPAGPAPAAEVPAVTPAPAAEVAAPEPIISEIPPTSELVGAEPTQPTIREVPEISPIVGAEPAAIVEQEPVAPAIQVPPKVENVSSIPTPEEAQRWDNLSAYQKPIIESQETGSLDLLASKIGIKRQGVSDAKLKEKIISNTHPDDIQDALVELNLSEPSPTTVAAAPAPAPVTTPPVTEAVTPAAEQPVVSIPASGKPFEFFSIRNKEKAPSLGIQFGQDVEPSGKYISQSTPDAAKNLDARFEKKAVRFENPLVVEFGGEYGTATNWKNVLSSQYGGKTGKELSQAIRDAGYDGIVTVEPAKGPNRPASTSEIVDISSLKPKKQVVAPTPAVPVEPSAEAASTVTKDVKTSRYVQFLGDNAPQAIVEAKAALEAFKTTMLGKRDDNPFQAEPRLRELKNVISLFVANRLSVTNQNADKIAEQIILGEPNIVDKATELKPIKAKELDDIGANRSSIMRFGYELGDKKTYRHPREGEAIATTISATAEPVAEPAGISVGNRIKLGKSPQTYTIEEVIPQSATERELGEQYYSVKNERTGETQVVEARDLKQVKGKGARKISTTAIDTTPENILTTPPDQQYTFEEVFDVAYDMFGGEIPEGFTIVNDSKDKEFEFKAAYIPESGEIIVNLAYLNKNDDIRDTITHELGHYIFGDPEFRAAFDQFIASLSPEARADLDAYVETAYNKYTGEIRLEEKMVRAFVDQFISEEQAPAWRSMLDAIKRFLNKLGFKFNISDRDAISVFTAALDRYKAGEAISREGGARLMAAEPAPKRRKEQVGGAEREETRYITTPKGILSMNTDVLREKFFDGTSVSPEKTTQAWGYISRLLDIKSGNANELAGEINDTVIAELEARRDAAIAAGEDVDPDENLEERIGAAMFSVELMNYAGKLAEQGDQRMLKFMIRNVNSMPVDKYAGGISDLAIGLRTRLEYDVSGFGAYSADQKGKVERTAAVMFGTNKPNEDQFNTVKDALDKSEKTELGNPEEVAGDIENVEKRTGKSVVKKIEEKIKASTAPKKEELLISFQNLNQDRKFAGINIVYKPQKIDPAKNIQNLIIGKLVDYRKTLIKQGADGLESTFWQTMSNKERKPGPLGEIDQAQNNELANIVQKTLIDLGMKGEPPNTKMTDIEKVASILNKQLLGEEKKIAADKRVVEEIDRRRSTELEGASDADAVNAKYDAILNAWNEAMSRQTNMPISDNMLQRLINSELKEQGSNVTELINEPYEDVLSQKKKNIVESIIRRVYGVSKEAETGIEISEDYDNLSRYLKQTLENMLKMQAEKRDAAVARTLQRGLGDLPALPEVQKNKAQTIVQQDLRQQPDMGRREPWQNMLVGKLTQAGVAPEQAENIANLVWRQHEINDANRKIKEMKTAAEKGSLAVIIDRIKNTSLEKQQSPEWKQEVIKEYLRDAGLSSQAAETAAKLYDSIISERLAAAKQKAFEDTLAKAAPWKNYASRNGKLAKDALKKIKEAIRAGVLDPEKNAESIIAALNGWTGFTKEQYQRIVQIDTILNDPEKDDITKREAMDELNRIISKAKLPVSAREAIGPYYVGQALGGIPTATVNVASPIGFSIRNLMVDISKYAATDPAKIPIAFESFLDSMRSWYNQTAYAYKNQIYLNDVVEYLNGQNVLRELFDKGKQQWAEGKYAEGLKNMAIGMMQITGRVLSALDQGAISMLENQNITRYAMAALENAKDKVPKNKIREFANMTLDLKRRVITENIAAGMDKNRAVVLADLAVKSEIRAALSEFGVSYKDVLDSAVNDALQSVGRNKVITIEGVKKVQQDISDSGFLSYPPIKFLEWIASSAGQGGPAMQIFSKMVYGFALIPARTFSTAAWFSPYGFLRLAIDKYNKNKGQESPYAMSLQTEAQFKQRLTDSIAGSIVMLALFAMRSGSSDDEDDKLFKIVITGNGPNATTDKQYYDTWIKNHKPYSIELHFGDSKATINIGRGGEALFFPIMLAGALDDWEIKKKQNLTKKEPSDLNIATELLGSAFFALAQRGPYAAFTEPLFDASKQGRVTENLVGQLGYFGKTFIPVLGTSITRNISDFINDPVDRSSIEGALYANTPIVGPWIGTKALNALGQPIRADDFSDKLFKLGVPVVFSFPKNTPENALNEIILKQGSGPTIPTRSNAQKRFGDVLTDKEFETYVREYGRVMSDKMFKSRTKLANMKPADYDDELEKYARGYSIDGIKIKGASDSAVLAVKRMRQ